MEDTRSNCWLTSILLIEECEVKPMDIIQVLEKDEVFTLDIMTDAWWEHDFSKYEVVYHVAGIAYAGGSVLSMTDSSKDIGDVVEKGGFGWKCLSKSNKDFANKVKKYKFG